MGPLSHQTPQHICLCWGNLVNPSVATKKLNLLKAIDRDVPTQITNGQKEQKNLFCTLEKGTLLEQL